MITLRILLAPGRRGRVVDASGRSLPQPVPAPVIGSAEPLRIILLDPASLDPADPYGFDTGAPLRLTISGDWDPATIPVYCTNALERTGVGTYDLADPSGTRTAEALALLGVLAERLCAWELTAYGGDPATEADWAHPLSVVQFDAPLRQRADSLGGDPTEAPAVDLRGPEGPKGPSGRDGIMQSPDGMVVASIANGTNALALNHPHKAKWIVSSGEDPHFFPWETTDPSQMTGLPFPDGAEVYLEEGKTVADYNAGDAMCLAIFTYNGRLYAGFGNNGAHWAASGVLVYTNGVYSTNFAQSHERVIYENRVSTILPED